MAHMNLELFSTRLNNMSGREINHNALKDLQEFEKDFNAYKVEVLKRFFQQKQIVTLDNFFSTLSSILGTVYSYYDKIYAIDRIVEYGNKSEMQITRYNRICIVAPTEKFNITEEKVHYIAYLNLFKKLLDTESDFLFYCEEDATLFSDVLKTDEEILLPDGNSMKYFAGSDSQDFRNAIKLANDYVNSFGIPLSLRLK